MLINKRKSKQTKRTCYLVDFAVPADHKVKIFKKGKYLDLAREIKERQVLVLYTHLPYHNDSIIETDARRKRQEDFFNNILPLTLLQGFERVVQGFACERVLETEHKLHILTPLLWPSRCVFLVLLMLGSTPSGVSEGSLGRVWLSLLHLVSSCLEFYWQLLWHPKLNWVK